MAKRSVTNTVEYDGLTETVAAFRKLPKEAKKRIKDAAASITKKLEPKARAAAASDFSPQSSLAVSTIKAQGGSEPVIKAGGSRRVGSRRTPVYKVLFGSEFGSNRYPQFGRAHTGQSGNWFFPVVEQNSRTIADEWGNAADDIVRDFTQGGLL